MSSRLDDYIKRGEALESERSSWWSHWQDIANYILPRRGRFLSSDANRGSKKNDKIIRSVATRAAKIMQSGMSAGCSSQAQPWFRLTTPFPELAERDDVRSWLHHVEEVLRYVLARSKFYNPLTEAYGDLGVFGTAVTIIDADDENIMRGYPIPCGQYCLALDEYGRPDTLRRKFTMSAKQVVGKFRPERISERTHRLAKDKPYERIEVVHWLEQRRLRVAGAVDAKNMPWASLWYEVGQKDFLEESGYEEKPFLAARWDVTNSMEDAYGRGPGMDCLGDVKELQHRAKNKAKLIDKAADPALRVPASMLGQRFSLVPGDINYTPDNSSAKVEPVQDIPPAAIVAVREDEQELAQYIMQAFHADLFLMFASSDRRQITAEEIRARKEEEMLQVGPVLDRLGEECFDPLIDRTFGIAVRRGMIPRPPDAIIEAGGEIYRVEYVSTLAQARKLMQVGSVDRLVAFTGNLATASQDLGVFDKLNKDELVDSYADMLGINPDLVNSDDEVARIRNERAQQAKAQQDAAMAMEGAKAAGTLAKAPMGQDSALDRLVSNVSPVAAGMVGAA